jgi:hypothetical protein
VELASPADFIPVKSGWQEGSPFVAQEGHVLQKFCKTIEGQVLTAPEMADPEKRNHAVTTRRLPCGE